MLVVQNSNQVSVGGKDTITGASLLLPGVRISRELESGIGARDLTHHGVLMQDAVPQPASHRLG